MNPRSSLNHVLNEIRFVFKAILIQILNAIKDMKLSRWNLFFNQIHDLNGVLKPPVRAIAPDHFPVLPLWHLFKESLRLNPVSRDPDLIIWNSLTGLNIVLMKLT